ncbi:MAG TPA: DNA primase [Candidatus Pacearchaeota archaeon]|nr:DNA primase [Candidatus Pacearchaeota archaeon]HPR79899.1 DNA primase [Candidatus Pacearchaeota archaeon]
MNSDIEEIKSRLNIVDVVGSYIKLEKAGINYRARCPFHNEKSASFFVSPSRQLWHCFGGCNEGGDIFKFVMKIEGVDFIDALKILADKAGVALKRDSEDWQKVKNERQILIDLLERSCKFYTAQLEKSKTGRGAIEYLLKRGMKEETIREWRLGYAPDTWTGLSDYLIGQGFKRKDIVSGGLGIKKDSAKFFDRFRSRIMFPILNLNSQVSGFTGRIFNSEDEAKYLNTPNTLLYDKSRALYGMDKAKLEVRQKDFCVLVEGNVDCIMSHQAGIKNCIAVSGTALTPLHLGIIKRYSSNLVLAFDMDIAGNNATKKGIDLALKNGFNVKVISMVAEKDPADIIFLEGEEKWRDLVNSAKPINEFYFELAFKNRNPEVFEDKKKIIAELLPVLKKIDNNIEQSHWIENMSQRLRIKDEDIRAEMKKVKIEENNIFKKEVINIKEKKTRREMLEEDILSLTLLEPVKAFELTEEMIEVFSPEAKEVFLKIKNKEDLGVSDYASYILIRSELMKEVEDLIVNEEWNKCLNELQSLIKKQERDRLIQEIKSKEKEGAFADVKELLLKFNKLIKNNEENKKEVNQKGEAQKAVEESCEKKEACEEESSGKES